MNNYKKIYENIYGKIPKEFVIHHIDHNPKNNKELNLVAIPKILHLKYHRLYEFLLQYNTPCLIVQNEDYLLEKYLKFKQLYLEIINYANEKLEN